MKTNKFIVAAMALSLLAACSQDDAGEYSPEQSDITLNAQDFEKDWVSGENGTRTSLTLDNDKGLLFKWTDGDKVGVFAKTQDGGNGGQLAMTMIGGDDTGKKAYFERDGYLLKEGVTYVSYYPLYDKVTADPNIDVTYLNQEQAANGDYSHLAAYDYMVSEPVVVQKTNTADFIFKHQGAILRLLISMPVADTYESLKLSATDEYGSLASVFTTKAQLDLFNEKDVLVPAATSDIMTLNFKNNSVSTTAANNVLEAWLMISPADFTTNTMTITVKSATGKADVVYTVNPKKNFVKGKAYQIKVPEVDHSKNPLLKWAEKDLVRSGSGSNVRGTFANNYTTTGYYYQFGRNYGYSSANDAAQKYGVERSDMESNRNVYPGTGSTAVVSTYYASTINFANYPNYFFIDNNHGGDYTTPSRSQTWSERAGSNGYEYDSPCPEGWRLPTIAEYKEILPVIDGKAGNIGTSAWNTLAQFKTLSDGTRCAFRWSKSTIEDYSYLKIECLVVDNGMTDISAVNWNDGNVKVRYFKGAGYIQAHRNLWQFINSLGGISTHYTARPLEWGYYDGAVQNNGTVKVTLTQSYMSYGGFYWTSDKEQGVFTMIFNSSTGYNLGYYLSQYDSAIGANIRCIKDTK